VNKRTTQRRGWLWSIAGMGWHAIKVMTVAGIAVALLLAGLVYVTVQETPEVDRLQTVRAVQPSVILEADGS